MFRVAAANTDLQVRFVVRCILQWCFPLYSDLRKAAEPVEISRVCALHGNVQPATVIMRLHQRPHPQNIYDVPAESEAGG